MVSDCSLHSLVPVWRCGAVANLGCSRPSSSKSILMSSQPEHSLAVLLSNPAGCFEASIPDGVVGLQADPLGDGPVLLLGLGQLLLGAERLVGLSQELARRGHGMLGAWNRRSGTYRHLDGVVWMSL